MNQPIEQLPVQQWTQAEVKAAYAQGRYDDIEQARQAGALNRLLGVPEETA